MEEYFAASLKEKSNCGKKCWIIGIRIILLIFMHLDDQGRHMITHQDGKIFWRTIVPSLLFFIWYGHLIQIKIMTSFNGVILWLSIIRKDVTKISFLKNMTGTKKSYLQPPSSLFNYRFEAHLRLVN